MTYKEFGLYVVIIRRNNYNDNQLISLVLISGYKISANLHSSFQETFNEIIKRKLLEMIKP